MSSRYFQNRLPDLAPGLHALMDRQHLMDSVIEMSNSVVTGKPPTFDNCDGGLYVGNAGVAYMFYYLATSEPMAHLKADLMTKARNFMDVSCGYALGKRCKDPPAAFLLGGAGVFAVAALIYHELGQEETCKDFIQKYQSLAAVCQPVNYMGNGSDELFVGRAGYLCGALLLNRKFGEVISKESLHKICHSILHSGREYAKKHKSRSPLMYAYYNTEYLGAAHGLCAILQMLLHFPEYLKSDPVIEDEVHRTVDFMLSLMQGNGNFAPAMDEADGESSRPVEHELIHWCHGAPGVVYMLAKAFKYYKDEKYLLACLKCGEITWQKGLLKKGPGICHGVAGSGYVFLLLYRLTADEKHLHRANKFAEYMDTAEFQQGAKRPDSPYSLYEGIAGTVCFLVDLLQPHKAEFPFFDVVG